MALAMTSVCRSVSSFSFAFSHCSPSAHHRMRPENAQINVFMHVSCDTVRSNKYSRKNMSISNFSGAMENARDFGLNASVIRDGTVNKQGTHHQTKNARLSVSINLQRAQEYSRVKKSSKEPAPATTHFAMGCLWKVNWPPALCNPGPPISFVETCSRLCL